MLSSMEGEEPIAKRTRSSSRKNLIQKITSKSPKSIWLPTECWVDTLKLLSRRQLLHGMQPACRRLHAISELPDVPSVHIIHNFRRFLNALVRNQPEANQRYAELIASKADLTRHIRLGEKVEIQMERLIRDKSQVAYKHRLQLQMDLLRHSLELFRGCQLQLELREGVPTGEYLAYLSLLALTRPSCIELYRYTKVPKLQPDEMLRNPTILACPRLTLDTYLVTHYQLELPSSEPIFQWLHHLPSAEEVEMDKNSTTTRIFILKIFILPKTAAELIERCKQALQLAKSVSDRRSFMLFNFGLKDLSKSLPLFKMENNDSGEVLQLEKYRTPPPWPYMVYRLRRCPAVELANAEQFYNDNFQGEETNERFRAPLMDNGLEAPILGIVDE